MNLLFSCFAVTVVQIGLKLQIRVQYVAQTQTVHRCIATGRILEGLYLEGLYLSVAMRANLHIRSRRQNKKYLNRSPTLVIRYTNQNFATGTSLTFYRHPEPLIGFVFVFAGWIQLIAVHFYEIKSTRHR